MEQEETRSRLNPKAWDRGTWVMVTLWIVGLWILAGVLFGRT